MPTYFTFTGDAARKIADDHRDQRESVKAEARQHVRWMERTPVRHEVLVGKVSETVTAVQKAHSQSEYDETTENRDKPGLGSVVPYKLDRDGLLIPTRQNAVTVYNMCVDEIAVDAMVMCKREPFSGQWFVDLECCE